MGEAPLEHDPEKWIPVFGKDHAPPVEHVGGAGAASIGLDEILKALN
jgi:hypothetical protein